MRIELIGLPGSGKSTFAKKLSEDRRYTIVRVRSRTELIWYNIIFFIAHPYRSVRLFLLFFPYLLGGKYRYEKFVNLFLVANAKYIKAASIERAIIDQGHHQILFSLFDEVISEKKFRKIITLIPHTEEAILFDLARSVRERHLEERGYGVRSGADEAYLVSWEHVREVHAARLVEEFGTRERYRGTVRAVLRNYDEIALSQEQHLKSSELWYVLNARFPTEKAYGNQVAKMMEEFGKIGVRGTVLSPLRRKNPIQESPYAYYSVEQNFSFREMVVFELPHLFWKLSSKFSFYVESLLYLIALLFQKIPHDVVCYVRKPSIAVLLKLKRCNVAYECHDWFARYPSLFVFLLRKVDHIITTNRYIKQEFVAHGITDKRISIFPNGVDLSIFERDESREEALKELSESVNENTHVLLYTGSFTTMGIDKGIEDIFKAMKVLPIKEVLFIAVGGSDQDILRYKNFAEALGVDPASYRLVGRRSKEEIALYQRVASILLMPFPKRAHYEYHMSPLKTFEYMASGRPIIASALPSIKEILVDEIAYFVPPDDPDALSEMISHVLLHTEEATRRAIHARQHVASYTWTERAKGINKVIFTQSE